MDTGPEADTSPRSRPVTPERVELARLPPEDHENRAPLS